MNVGLGLPVSDPVALLDWARRADAGPFTTLGMLDRLVYHNPEPLVALAAIAGATARVRVQTEVLLAPLRDPVLLAKQTATLDRISGGRFTLGVGLGPRQDDYVAAGVDMRRRGRRLEEQMAVMRRIWSGGAAGEGVGPIGPSPTAARGPEVLFGAFAPPAVERAARWGDGLLAAAPLPYSDTLFRLAEQAWRAAGRPERPRLVAQVNVALGADAVVAQAREAIGSYYGDHGPQILGRLLTAQGSVRDALVAFGDLGADEVMLYCWSVDSSQVDRLADAVG